MESYGYTTEDEWMEPQKAQRMGFVPIPDHSYNIPNGMMPPPPESQVAYRQPSMEDGDVRQAMGERAPVCPVQGGNFTGQMRPYRAGGMSGMDRMNNAKKDGMNNRKHADSMEMNMNRMNGMNQMDNMGRMNGMNQMDNMGRMNGMNQMDNMGRMNGANQMDNMGRMNGMNQMDGMNRMNGMERDAMESAPNHGDMHMEMHMDMRYAMAEALRGIENAVMGEAQDRMFYEWLMAHAPNEEDKKIIAGIRDDEMRHYTMFRQMYFEMTGKTPLKEQAPAFMPPASYCHGLKDALMGEQNAVVKYRKILFAMHNRKHINMLTEIITDEIRHMGLYNYMYAKNKCMV
ncbi:MAG: ferritin family protein [Christensenellales bacterium]